MFMHSASFIFLKFIIIFVELGGGVDDGLRWCSADVDVELGF